MKTNFQQTVLKSDEVTTLHSSCLCTPGSRVTVVAAPPLAEGDPRVGGWASAGNTSP